MSPAKENVGICLSTKICSPGYRVTIEKEKGRIHDISKLRSESISLTMSLPSYDTDAIQE